MTLFLFFFLFLQKRANYKSTQLLQLRQKDISYLFVFGGFHKLRWQDFVHYWPPTPSWHMWRNSSTVKVEKIEEDSLDSIPSLQWKFKLLARKFTWGKGALPLHLSTVYFSHLSYIRDKLRKCIHISKPLSVIDSCCQWNKQIIILSFVENFFNFFFSLLHSKI